MRFTRMKSFGLGAVVALALGLVVSPALGGPSLKSLVKKEVKKQLRGKSGPPGPQGTPGTPGATGSAAAFAQIEGGGTVDDDLSLNVTDADVTDPSTGVYCIGGLPFQPRNAVATPEAASTADTQDRIAAVLVAGPGSTPFGCAVGDQIRVQIIDLGLIGATAEGFADNYVFVWIED